MRHTPTTARSRAPRDAGFTLAEVLVCTVLVGVGLVGVSWLMTMAAQTQAVHAANSGDTLVVAREIHELADALPRTPSGSGAAKAFSDVVALDSLDGAVFNPPIRADGTALSSWSGWTQRVDLSLRDLTDPTIVEDAGVPAVVRGDDVIFRLQVEILESGTVLDTYEWWIQP